MSRNVWRLIFLTAVMVWATCLAQQMPSFTNCTVVAANAATSNGGFTGEWAGTTTTGPQANKIAGKIRSIRFHIKQGADGQIEGTYTCKSGRKSNSFCRNFEETGTIAGGRIGDGRWELTVIVHPDSSSCDYQGKVVDNAAHGEYTCTLQGSKVEQGTWQAKMRSAP